MEPEGISRRHGICGDPEQVRAVGLDIRTSERGDRS